MSSARLLDDISLSKILHYSENKLFRQHKLDFSEKKYISDEDISSSNQNFNLIRGALESSESQLCHAFRFGPISSLLSSILALEYGTF